MNRVSKSRIVYSLIVLLLCLIVANCNRIIEQRKHYYYDRGMKLFNNSDYINAAKEFGKALQLDERYFDALYMKCMSHYNAGDYGTAQACFDKSAAERPEDVRVKLKIAECLLIGGRPGRTKNYFNTVISRLAENNRDAKILMLKYYLKLGNLVEAEKIIDKLLKEGEKDTRFFALLTQFKAEQNKLPEAADIALKHFSVNLDWMTAMQRIIKRLKSSENYDALEKIYTKIIEQAKDKNKLLYQQELANLYRQRGEEEKEERLFRVMLNDYPDMFEVKRDYINYLNHYNRKSQIEPFINEAINKQPQNIDLKKLSIEYYMQTGQTQKAFQTAEKIISTLPAADNSYFDFQNILADLHFRGGEYEKAKRIVEDILSKHRLDRGARFLRCKIYTQEGNALSAIGELRQLVSENPTIAEFSYYLGLAHQMRGENASAEKAFRTALDISPDYKEVLKKWIAIYPKKGSLSEPEIKIKRYLELHPNDSEIKELQESIQRQKADIMSFSNISEKAKHSVAFCSPSISCCHQKS